MSGGGGNMVTSKDKAKCVKALEELGGVALLYEIATKADISMEVAKKAMDALLKSEWVRLG
jgi:hypothetical protein